MPPRPCPPLSLLALDLNHFKLINDTLGHLRGDQVLYDVAQAVVQSVRGSDLVCRIGGDEFAVIAPHTTSQEAETPPIPPNSARSPTKDCMSNDRMYSDRENMH